MNSREKLIVELSRALLARAADEAEKRSKQSDRALGKYSATDAEVKRRQAYRFNKAVADRTAKSADARTKAATKQLNKDVPTPKKTQYPAQANLKAGAIDARRKEASSKESKSLKKQFGKGSLMRGVKRIIRKFSGSEKARQEKRYGDAKSLQPKVSTIDLQKRDNPKTPTMKIPTYKPGKGERMAQGVLRRERKLKPVYNENLSYRDYIDLEQQRAGSSDRRKSVMVRRRGRGARILLTRPRRGGTSR